MTGHAAPPGLPERDQRLRATTPAAHERPGQGRRNPGAAASDHGPGTPTGQRPATVLTRRSSVPRGTTTPTPGRHASSAPTAGTSGDSAAVAPGPHRAPPRGEIPYQAARPSTDHPLDPAPGAAPGARESHLGLPAASTANSSGSASKSPPPRYGRSSRTPESIRRPSAPPLPGRPFSARRPTPCLPATSSRPARATTTSNRSSSAHPPRHPPTATTGRYPQRVPPRRLTCTDDIFGRHSAGRGSGRR